MESTASIQAEKPVKAEKKEYKGIVRIWKLPGGPLFLLAFPVIAAALIYAVLYYGFHIDLYAKLGLSEVKCAFRSMTGFYCPGCGGTRATLHLMRFHPIHSFLMHPLPLLLALWYLNFFVRFIFAYLVPENFPLKLKPARFRPVYPIILAVAILVNFIVRNVLLLNGIFTL